MISYEVENNKLIVANNEIYFEYKIGQIVEFENVLFVLLDDPKDMQGTENVYGVNDEGEILWQIKPRKYPAEQRPFVNLYFEKGGLWLGNFSGYEYRVDSKTGEIIEMIFLK